MRIVIDARMLGWSGVGRYTRHLLQHLQHQDKVNSYLVLLSPGDFSHWQPSSFNFEKVLCPHRPFSVGEQFGLALQLYKLKPDLVHFLSYNAPVLYLRKRMVTIHDLSMVRFKNYHGGPLKRLITWVKYWPMRFALRCIVMRSAKIITPSAYVKKEILRHWGKDVFYARLKSKIHVIYEAVDKLSAQPKAVASLKNKEFLLFVGNAYPHKNLDKLVEAFEIISVQQPQLKLVLAGRPDPYYAGLQRRVARSGMKNVVFIGNADDAKLVWLYQHATTFVFASLSEGFGLPGLEAMQYSLPVAAADASCLPEIYGDAALYFKPDQPTNMASVVMKLLDNPGLRQKLVSKARARLSQFSWAAMAEQTRQLYK
jgi:glycosyltransferase involved in cell wall biosynthesis